MSSGEITRGRQTGTSRLPDKVVVTAAEQQTDRKSGEGFTAYIVEVSANGASWTLMFRYSTLFKLHSQLMSRMGDRREVERLDRLFPPKRFLNSSFSVVNERKQALGRYFDQLLLSSEVRDRPFLLAQFGLTTPPNQTSSTPTTVADPTDPISASLSASTFSPIPPPTGTQAPLSSASSSSVAMTSGVRGALDKKPKKKGLSQSMRPSSALWKGAESFGPLNNESSVARPTTDLVRMRVPGYTLLQEIPMALTNYPLHVHVAIASQLPRSRAYFRAERKATSHYQLPTLETTSILGPAEFHFDPSFSVGLQSILGGASSSLQTPAATELHLPYPQIVKLFLAPEADIQARSLLTHETTLLSRLAFVRGAPRLAQKIAYPSLDYSGGVVIEDISSHSIPLSLLMPLGPKTSATTEDPTSLRSRLAFFFQIAFELLGAIGRLHEVGLLHTAISPFSVWCDISPIRNSNSTSNSTGSSSASSQQQNSDQTTVSSK